MMLVLPQKHTRTHTLMCAFLLFNVATEFLASTKLNPINMQRKSIFFFSQCCSAFCIPITCVFPLNLHIYTKIKLSMLTILEPVHNRC